MAKILDDRELVRFKDVNGQFNSSGCTLSIVDRERDNHGARVLHKIENGSNGV